MAVWLREGLVKLGPTFIKVRLPTYGSASTIIITRALGPVLQLDLRLHNLVPPSPTYPGSERATHFQSLASIYIYIYTIAAYLFIYLSFYLSVPTSGEASRVQQTARGGCSMGRGQPLQPAA